jgi:hypothetical protein
MIFANVEHHRICGDAELKDVGDQAPMRGLDTAFPIMRPRTQCGRWLDIEHGSESVCPYVLDCLEYQLSLFAR